MKEFINKSDNIFTKISTEKWRKYIYSDKSEVLILEPHMLSISDSGGHRIFDMEGYSHYIPKGWIHLTWLAKDGEAHFVK